MSCIVSLSARGRIEPGIALICVSFNITCDGNTSCNTYTLPCFTHCNVSLCCTMQHGNALRNISCTHCNRVLCPMLQYVCTISCRDCKEHICMGCNTYIVCPVNGASFTYCHVSRLQYIHKMLHTYCNPYINT